MKVQKKVCDEAATVSHVGALTDRHHVKENSIKFWSLGRNIG